MAERVELIIGRGEDCDVRVDDEYASPRHAKLTIYSDERVTVEDLGSTNGTWTMFGGHLPGRVYAPTPCGPFTVLRVGRTRLPVVDLLTIAARRSDG